MPQTALLFIAGIIIALLVIAGLVIARNREAAYQRADFYRRLMLHELPVGVCVLSRHKRILIWNDTLQRLSGVSAESVDGLTLEEIPDPWGNLFKQCLADEDNRLRSREVATPTGYRWINIIVTKPRLRMIVVEDITEIQLMEQTLTHQQRLASIGRLAAGVAHEIGNPVTGIACLAQNLREEPDHPDNRQLAGEMLQQTSRINSIVQSLVHFAHPGNSGDETHLQPVNVADCASEAIKLLNLDTGAEPMRFINDCGESVCVQADEQRLLQVLINLLSNARDASERDAEVTVTTECHDSRCVIAVTDIGDGIPDAIKDQIFEPFFTTKQPGKGTGLGLALVYQIINELQGELEVISPTHDNGRGTSFRITLPRSAPPSA